MGTILKEFGIGVGRVVGIAVVTGITIRTLDKAIDMVTSRRKKEEKKEGE